MKTITYCNLSIVDPKKDAPYKGGIIIKDGVIADVGNHITQGIDKKGLILMPGLVDLRVHLSDPGVRHKESLENIILLATRGGVTSMVAQPTTTPPLDNASILHSMMARKNAIKGAHLYFTGALTAKLQGRQLAEMGLMKNIGIVAVSNGDNPVKDTLILKRAFLYASTFDLPIHMHALDCDLSKDGMINASSLSTKMGLRGIPAIAETLEVIRLITLAKALKAKLHISHISCLGAIEHIRQAKRQNLPISTDVCHHHLALTENAIADYRTYTKILPPLRSEQDRRALLLAVKDGTIDAIVSDHKAQDLDVKRVPFVQASFGAIGLQTLLPITLDLWRNGTMSLNQAVRCITLAPSTIADIAAGTLDVGASADVILVDPDEKIIIDKHYLGGKCQNSPYEGTILRGRVKETFVSGSQLYKSRLSKSCKAVKEHKA